MSRTIRIVLGVVVLGLIVMVTAGAYIVVRGGSGEASRSAADFAATQAASYLYPTEAATEPANAAETPEPTKDVTTQPAGATGTGVVFNIIPEESEVRFEIDDVRSGQPETVVGRTNQVAGQINVNFDDPVQTKLGTIVVNLRTLATDIGLRDSVIRGEILLSAQDEFEFGQFEPTSITGLPEQVTMGEPFTFQITGNLVLRGISNEVTFDATVTPISETRLEGTASAVVQREQYGLEIPSIPFVASVEEDVELHIDFVATA
jgi:polyisoprenoid-binding protein YceI